MHIGNKRLTKHKRKEKEKKKRGSNQKGNFIIIKKNVKGRMRYLKKGWYCNIISSYKT